MMRNKPPVADRESPLRGGAACANPAFIDAGDNRREVRAGARGPARSPGE